MDNVMYLKKIVSEDVKKKESSIPDYLLKFQPLDIDKDEMIFKSLENKKMWFSGIKYLNDPEEFKGLYLDRDTLEKAGISQKLIQHFRGIFNLDDFGVTCLSACDIYDGPMWAHYANYSKGFVVEYEVIKKAAIHKVDYYKEKKPIGNYLIQLRNELVSTNGMGNEKSVQIVRKLMKILYMKNDSWSAEKEYRIVQPIDEEKGQEYPLDHLGMKVKRIIAGFNCSKSNIERLNIISNQLGCGNAYVIIRNEDNYSLEIVRVRS